MTREQVLGRARAYHWKGILHLEPGTLGIQYISLAQVRHITRG